MMKPSYLKIKRNFLLFMLLVMVLLSILIIVTSFVTSRTNMNHALSGVKEGFTGIGETSLSQATQAIDDVRKSILDRNDVAAVEKIAKTSQDGSVQVSESIVKIVDNAGNKIKTRVSENKRAINKELDGFFNGSEASFNALTDFDDQSATLVSDQVSQTIDSLKNAKIDKIKNQEAQLEGFKENLLNLNKKTSETLYNLGTELTQSNQTPFQNIKDTKKKFAKNLAQVKQESSNHIESITKVSINQLNAQQEQLKEIKTNLLNVNKKINEIFDTLFAELVQSIQAPEVNIADEVAQFTKKMDLAKQKNSSHIESVSSKGIEELSAQEDEIKKAKVDLLNVNQTANESLDNLYASLTQGTQHASVEIETASKEFTKKLEKLKQQNSDNINLVTTQLLENFVRESNVSKNKINLLATQLLHSSNEEFEKIKTRKSEKEMEILTGLREKNTGIKTRIAVSIEEVDKELESLKSNLPNQIKGTTDQAFKKIEDQTIEYSKTAKAVQKSFQDKLGSTKIQMTDRLSQSMSGSETILNEIISNVQNKTLPIILIATFTFVVIGLVMGFYIIDRLLKPMIGLSNESEEDSEAVSNGDNRILLGISDNIEKVSGSTNTITKISNELITDIHQVNEKIIAVKNAEKSVEEDFEGLSNIMEETTQHVDTVAVAANEMSDTILNISQNTKEAKQITEGAVAAANSASTQVGDLGSSARNIDRVIETITDISEQVNLLALNATIEAARAGEAGKGFAVVASEIKELAKQTAEASNEIKEQVKSIQDSTDSTVSEIIDIEKTIQRIDGIVSTVSMAIDEQSITFGEIASNASHAVEGLEQTNSHIADSTQKIAKINSDVSDVSVVTRQMSENSSGLSKSVDELNSLASELAEAVGGLIV